MWHTRHSLGSSYLFCAREGTDADDTARRAAGLSPAVNDRCLLTALYEFHFQFDRSTSLPEGGTRVVTSVDSEHGGRPRPRSPDSGTPNTDEFALGESGRSVGVRVWSHLRLTPDAELRLTVTLSTNPLSALALGIGHLYGVVGIVRDDATVMSLSDAAQGRSEIEIGLVCRSSLL